jgi:hypothetical protein
VCAIPVVSIQYATIKKQSINTQHFIKANLKEQNVSAVQGSHHQAIYFRIYRKKITQLYDFLPLFSEIWPNDGCFVQPKHVAVSDSLK